MKKVKLIFLFAILIGYMQSSLYSQGLYPPSLDPISWNLILEDNFDSNDYDREKWFARYGKVVDGINFTNDENVKVDSGYLHLGVKDYEKNVFIVGNDTCRFTSSEFRSGVSVSKYSGNYLYGYFEFMANIPEGKGFYTSLWLSTLNGQTDPAKTSPPELDLLEVIGNEKYQYNGTTHTITHYIPDPINIGDSIQIQCDSAVIDHRLITVNDQYLHEGDFIYGLDWHKNKIRWYLENDTIGMIEDECIPEKPLSIVMSVRMDKRNLPHFDSNTYLEEEFHKIDYVRVYKRNWHYTHFNDAAASLVAGDIIANPDGNQVFYRNKNNAIKGMYYDNNDFIWKYTHWNDAASSFVAGDLAVSPNGNQVFYRNENGAIKGMYYDNDSLIWRYTNWNNAAGSNVAGDIVINPDGNQVFYRNDNGAIKGMYFDSDSLIWRYTNWNNAAGSFVAGDLAVSPNGNQVFYRNDNGAIKGMYYDSDSLIWRYTHWDYAANSNVAGDIVVNSAGNQVFYRDNDGAIKGMYYDSNVSKWKYTHWNDVASENVAGDLAINSDDILFYKNTTNGVNAIYYHNGAWYNGVLNDVASLNVEGDIAVIHNGLVCYKNSSNAIKGFYYKKITDPVEGYPGFDVGDSTIIKSGTIETTEESSLLEIYPNPNNGHFTISYKEKEIGEKAIQVIDSKGLILIEQITESNNIKIDLSPYKRGLYFVRLVSNGKVSVKSIIVN